MRRIRESRKIERKVEYCKEREKAEEQEIEREGGGERDKGEKRKYRRG